MTVPVLTKIIEDVSELFLIELSRHKCTMEDGKEIYSKDSSCTSSELVPSDIIDLTIDENEILFSIQYNCDCRPSSLFWMQFSAGSICVRVLSACVECLEKLRDYGEANRLLEMCLRQTVFGRHRRGHWWERLVLNLDSHLRESSKVMNVVFVVAAVMFWHWAMRYSDYNTLPF